MTELFTYEILIAGKWCKITDTELYESVNGDEREYFHILGERQKKQPGPMFFIPDAEPGIIPGNTI